MAKEGPPDWQYLESCRESMLGGGGGGNAFFKKKSKKGLDKT